MTAALSSALAAGVAVAASARRSRRSLTAVQQEVPDGALARVSAYDWLVSLGAQLLGYAAGPVLAQSWGYTWPLSGAAILVAITLLVPASLPSVRSTRIRAHG